MIGWAMAATQDEMLIETAFAWRCLVGIPQLECCFILIADRSTPVMQARAVLAQTSITASMSRTGNGYDNAVSESFFGTLKGECVERVSFQTRREATQTLFEYVECFYNRVRRHSSLGYMSPVAYEQVMC
ncbi:MAG: IS3 family transposase [Ktedonobacteraceae bacterium]